jgi:hypothetical protein
MLTILERPIALRLSARPFDGSEKIVILSLLPRGNLGFSIPPPFFTFFFKRGNVHALLF